MGLEGGVKYAFTSKLSSTLTLLYEKVFDEKAGAENYQMFAGGLFATWLF
jgi:hypothetical protein